MTEDRAIHARPKRTPDKSHPVDLDAALLQKMDIAMTRHLSQSLWQAQ